jgi:hypothetical protein
MTAGHLFGRDTVRTQSPTRRCPHEPVCHPRCCFAGLGPVPVESGFDGGRLTSDGGLPWDDADTVRTDPLLQLVCGRLPERDGDLASQPTLSRQENTVDRKSCYRLALALGEVYVRDRDRLRLPSRHSGQPLWDHLAVSCHLREYSGPVRRLMTSSNQSVPGSLPGSVSLSPGSDGPGTLGVAGRG